MRAKGKRGLLKPTLAAEQPLPAVGVTDETNNTQMLEEFHAAIMQSMGESAFEARQSRRMRGTLYRRAKQMSDGDGEGDGDPDAEQREHELDDADADELERHSRFAIILILSSAPCQTRLNSNIPNHRHSTGIHGMHGGDPSEKCKLFQGNGKPILVITEFNVMYCIITIMKASNCVVNIRRFRSIQQPRTRWQKFVRSQKKLRCVV